MDHFSIRIRPGLAVSFQLNRKIDGGTFISFEFPYFGEAGLRFVFYESAFKDSCGFRTLFRERTKLPRLP